MRVYVMLVVVHEQPRRVEDPVEDSAVDRARRVASREHDRTGRLDGDVLNIRAEAVHEWVHGRETEVVKEGRLEPADQVGNGDQREVGDGGDGEHTTLARPRLVDLEPPELAQDRQPRDVAEHRTPKGLARMKLQERRVR